MLERARRIITAEGPRRRHLEKQLLQWLNDQLLAPAPGRPRAVVLGKGTLLERSCHITPCAVTIGGKEYVDLEVRDRESGPITVTLRTNAGDARHIKTLWP